MSAQVREMDKPKFLAFSTGVLVAAMASCAPEVNSIDRTQPNALSKTMFSGLWYHRATVVEADPDASIVEGIVSNLEKIRWEITEDLLIAYRSYEFVPYAEGLTDEGRDFFGSPVAAFPIESHFDIQREYNRTTGVETNVISENTTDRPWNERQYIRVDWSENLVGQSTEFAIGFSNYPSGTLSGEAAVKYYVQGQEETSPDRPVFTEDYFDITNVYNIEPSTYFCLLLQLYQGVDRCGAANAKVRLAFRRVDPQDDYESLYYPDVFELTDDAGNAILLDLSGRPCSDAHDPRECTVQTWDYDAAYGNFRTLRVAFDRERFLTRSGRIYLVGRFDIWQDSFAVDGSLIPYEQRQPKPVVFYANTTFPRHLLEANQAMEDSWSKPFDETVALLKYHRNDLESGAGVRPAQLAESVAQVRQEAGGGMFQLRENDCNPENIVAYAELNDLTEVVDRVAGSTTRVAKGNVDSVCAAVQFAELQQGKTLDPKVAQRDGVPLAFTWQRLGDLRYNFSNYVEEEVPGPLGVAQFAQDPETGEYVGGNIANFFGNGGDRLAQQEVDVLQWLNGDLDEEALFRGDLTRSEIVSRRAVRDNTIHSGAKQFLMAHEGRLLEQSGGRLFEETTPGTEEARFADMWRGTDIERDFLVDDEMLRGFAGPQMFQPFGNLAPPSGTGLPDLDAGEVSDSALAAASVVNWGATPQSNEFMRVVRELGQNGVDMVDFFDPDSSGLAEYVKGWERQRIFDYVQTNIYTRIQAHEIGHTLGLRHNFEGSMDPVNYRPGFWWECPEGEDDCDESTALQRWASPPTEQNRTRGNEYKYASVMDYSFPLWVWDGIGTYDEGAIRFQYGQIQEVWDNQRVSIPDPRKYKSFARRCGHNNDFYGLPQLLDFLGPENLPRILSQSPLDQSACAGDYDGNDACDSAVDALFRDYVDRMESYADGQGFISDCPVFFTGAISELNILHRQIKNLEPRAENIYEARKFVSTGFLINQRKDVLANPPEYDNPATTTIDESDDNVDSDGDGVTDDKGFDWSQYQYPVKHAYCSDFYAGRSVPSCQPWDAGWDFEEAVQHQITQFDREYIFTHFRRDRLGETFGNPRTYIARLQARRLFHMTNVFRYYLYTRSSAFQADLYEDWAEAAYRGVNFLDRVLQAPEPGRYCLDVADDIYRPYPGFGECNRPLDVPLGYGGGYYLQSFWSDDYNYETNVIGFYYDKLAVIQQLTTSSGFFARDFSDLFDRRAFSLGYLRVYLDPMMQRFASLIEGDHTGYRSHVVTDPETQERYVRYMPLFDEELEDGSSVRSWLTQYPEIEPSWSWTLQYMSLAYSLGNWSSVNDYAPEMYRFTKISIPGTPEDVEYPEDMTVIEFTDPETFITYRAPVIEPLTEGGLVQEFPTYFGDRWHRDRNPPRFRYWGIGANILREANRFLVEEYNPAKEGCEQGVGVGPLAEGNRWLTADEACTAFSLARSGMNERTGFIDQVRKFNRVAEVPNPQ